MLNKIAIISAFIVLMLLVRLVKIGTIHFKSWWIASIVAVIVTIIAIVISMFL
jgi:hypothetical protein